MNPFFIKVERSAFFTILGISLLFSTAIIVTLIAPRHVDSSWVTPSSDYQVQMYTVADPHFYISSTSTKGHELEFVYHLKGDYTLLAFQETENVKIVAPKELENFVTRADDSLLKLTSKLLLLRKTDKFGVLELFDPGLKEAFARTQTEGILENFVTSDFVILDEVKPAYYQGKGVIFVKNPEEMRVKKSQFAGEIFWHVDPKGERINSLAELKASPFGFKSRQELIEKGETIYAHEGCFYCHTDQTRTLVQDVVLNGSAAYPAPPSTANEYVFQRVTFPGTRRIGPDISRVGVKRPSRDWHKSHFWYPKSESKGSIMPPFRHFFDEDPSGTSKNISESRVPNETFEAIYQYLMTKGTRITSPQEAWWLGKDAVNTKELIERR